MPSWLAPIHILILISSAFRCIFCRRFWVERNENALGILSWNFLLG